MNANGLRDGQAWAIAPGGAWQARLGRDGRAHVIGMDLALHPQHGPLYKDLARHRRWVRPGDRGFYREHRVAAFHERMVIAAKRQEVV